MKPGDTVTVRLDGERDLEAAVDYLAQSMVSPDSFEAYVTLPQGTERRVCPIRFSVRRAGKDAASACPHTQYIHRKTDRLYMFCGNGKEYSEWSVM